jgi:hypothetical protein
MNDIREMISKGRENAAKRIQINKHILFDVFDSNGVDGATVTFDGSGDSGSIHDIDLYREDGDDINGILLKNVSGAKVLISTGFDSQGFVENFSEATLTVHDLIESICYDALKAKHEGWENNEGAYGEFNFSSDNRTIGMEFNERMTEQHSHEF